MPSSTTTGTIPWAVSRYQEGLALLQREVENRGQTLEDAIAAFTDALTVFHRDELPQPFGVAHSNLGIAFADRVVGDHQDNLQQAIEHYQAALEVLTADENGMDWAGTQNNLAGAYLELERGDRSGNLEAALAACNAALTVIDRTSAPDEWAKVQSQLGRIYEASREGDRAENIEQAIHAWRNVLDVLGPAASALTLGALANTYLARLRGEKAENVEQAIHYCGLAMDAAPRATDPFNWAMAQTVLAQAYIDRPAGDRGDNLERAIACYRGVLEVYTRQASPLGWARAQQGLCFSYQQRRLGSRAENSEQAIAAGSSALEIYTRESDPESWATTNAYLSLAYGDRTNGDPGENLERSIAAAEAALTVFTSSSEFAERRAGVLNTRSLAYAKRPRGERAENVEVALRSAEEARSLVGSEISRFEFARATAFLGHAYLNRIRGDRLENLERSVALLRSAAQLMPKHEWPSVWATMQTSLGSALADRMLGDRGDNLEAALSAYEGALTVNTKDRSPSEWATLQLNVAATLLERVRGGRGQNLERALAACEAALTVQTREAAPAQWAELQNAMAAVLSVRIHGDRGENRERALQAVEASLSVADRERDAFSWARWQTNLGTAYAQRVKGNRAVNLQQATEAYRAALEIYSPERLPRESRAAAGALADLYIELRQWEEAVGALTISLQAAEGCYAAALTEDARTVEIETNSELYRKLVSAYLNLDPPRVRDAFLMAEEARSRILRDQVGALDLPAPSTIPTTELEAEARLLTSLRNAQNAVRLVTTDADREKLVSQAVQARDQVLALWDRFQSSYGAVDYVAIRRGARLRWDDLQAWLGSQTSEVAVVEFFSVDGGFLLFVVRRGEAEPRVERIEISVPRLADYIARFTREVARADRSHSEVETWTGLAEFLLTPLMGHLAAASLLYLIPHGLLHGLPLHALMVSGKRLIEQFPVAYVPSIAVAIRVSRHAAALRGAAGTEETAVVVGDPLGDLPYAASEARAVAKRFAVAPLLGPEATKEKVVAQLAKVAAGHLATHARFSPADPFSSGIALANAEILTAREVIAGSLATRLLVLSACQTGVEQIKRGDEVIGLSRAFLYAGVPAMILSLWSVNDESTSELMVRFYDHLRAPGAAGSVGAARALQAAMLETREQFPDTYNWAPFVLLGDSS